MKNLKAGDQNAARLIRQKNPRPDGEYRLSLYAYPFREGNRYALLHTMTGEALELTAAEWTDALSFQAAPQSWDHIVQKGLTELAEKRYLVERDYDEASAYADALFLLKTAKPQKKGISGYTILPTTACNARCVYCYEEGMPVQTMTAETADRLVDFIRETKADRPAGLSWFGGEPLAAAHIIRRVCAGLEARGVDFKSGMITNASLLTRELAREAKEKWRLDHAQVSLDGAREDYAARKRYVQPEKHNYDAVMRAIGYLAEEDIRVSLRVNVDMENLPRIEGFLDEMGAAFGDQKKVTLYLAALFQEQGGQNYEALQEALFALRDKLRALGLWRPTKQGIRSRMRLNYCMASNMDGSVVVAPDGKLYRCEHLPGAQSWGNIFDGVTDPALFDALRKAPEIDPECAKCPFLPQCTPFPKRGCPNCIGGCRVRQRLEMEDGLRVLLRGVKAEAETEADEDDDDAAL